MKHEPDQPRPSLVDAPPYLIFERFADHVRRELGCAHVDLLLIDYRLAALLPLSTSHAVGPGQPGPTDVTRVTTPAPVLAPIPAPYLAAGRPDLAPDRQDDRHSYDHNGTAWRCFDGQSPVLVGDVLCLPVTVRAERIGVLRVSSVTSGHVRILEDLADLLARELAAVRATTDRYVVAARSQRMTLAAEMQWELLPGRSCATAELSLAGQLEPAYAVRGDTFDWSLNDDYLSLIMIDGMGEGVRAASLTGVAVSALRNARRAEVDLVDQAMLADAALFAEYRGSQYISALLVGLDLQTGRLTTVDAGSPRVTLVRGGELSDLEFEVNDPLGMFDGTRYTSKQFQLCPADRLVLVSDGVHAADGADRTYGERELQRFLRRSRTMSALDTVRTLVNELRVFLAGELADDAAVVCLDWYGPADVQ